jgi:hypothetical protein
MTVTEEKLEEIRWLVWMAVVGVYVLIGVVLGK